MHYRKEIDGLRALAVLPVLLFHAGFEFFSGGFVGVDVFFVISGYLITTIIVSDIERGKFSLVQFYERRARRILPALYLVMLACIPFAWLWLMPSDMKDFSESLFAVALSISNHLFLSESGYFDTASELKPLLHTWSLAVEEQFYLLFPCLLMFVLARGKRLTLFVLTLLFVASLVLAQWAAYAKPAAAFFLLPTRAWELLIGAFAAFYTLQRRPPKISHGIGQLFAWVGMALIVFAVLAYDKSSPFPGVHALVPTLGAVLIILFATEQTSAGRVLGNKALVSIGLISYSTYLWHQPLFAFARHQGWTEAGHPIFLCLALLSMLLAYASWRFVEAPFRNKDRVSRKQVFTFAALGSAFFVCLGLMGHFWQAKWTSWRFDEKQIVTLDSIAFSPKRAACHFAQNEKSLSRQACRYFSDPVKVAVFGNSHATELAYAVATVLKDKDIGIVQHTMSGCRHNYHVASESDSVCAKWHQKVVDDLRADRAIEVVFLSYRNEAYLNDQKYRQALADMANDLADAGKRVVLVLQAPLPVAHIHQHIRENKRDLTAPIPSRPLAEWKAMYADANELLELLNGAVDVFDPVRLFCDTAHCFVTQNRQSLYFDDNHLSVAGATFIAQALANQYIATK